MKGILSVLLTALLMGAPDQAAGQAHGETHFPAVVGGVTSHVVRDGDTLIGIGARFGVDGAVLARDNELGTRAKLVVGQVIRIDNRHVVPKALGRAAIIVNLPQRMLFHGGEDGSVEAYPVAVGRPDWQTPSSEFVVIMKESEPTWDVPSSILEEGRRQGRLLPARVPPGPNNPLGAFWIGLSLPGIGLHGTNAPSSIFRAATHGCIRLHPEDIARLFAGIEVGARGQTVYEPMLLTEHEGIVYLEVHRDIYHRRVGNAFDEPRALADAAGLSERIDWSAAEAVVTAAHGVARDVTLRGQ